MTLDRLVKTRIFANCASSDEVVGCTCVCDGITNRCVGESAPCEICGHYEFAVPYILDLYLLHSIL